MTMQQKNNLHQITIDQYIDNIYDYETCKSFSDLSETQKHEIAGLILKSDQEGCIDLCDLDSKNKLNNLLSDYMLDGNLDRAVDIAEYLMQEATELLSEEINGMLKIRVNNDPEEDFQIEIDSIDLKQHI